MPSDESMGDEVYQPGSDETEVAPDEGVLDPEDTLSERGTDPYEEGWSPPERPLGAEHAGTTAREQREGESLDQRLAEEEPEPEPSAAGRTDRGAAGPADAADAADAAEGDGIGDLPGGAGEPLDGGAGGARAGRLVAPDEGRGPDEEKDLIGEDVGIDGAAASAEEAAVRLLPEDGQDPADPGGGGG